MKKTIALALCALFCIGAVSAQAAPKRLITQASLDKLLSDYGRISAEAESADIDMEADEDGSRADASASFLEIMRGNIAELKKDAGARAVLAKYGWDERFWDVMFAMSLSYYVIGFEAYGQTGALPPALKAQYEEAKKAVHPEDVALVYLNFDRISSVMNAEDGRAE